MKSASKKTKSKNLNIRMEPELYEFIEAKAKEQGMTKVDYFISQLDPKSELIKFLEDETERLEKHIQQIQVEHEKLIQENMLLIENLSDDKIIKLYNECTDDRENRKRIARIAKKKGINLQA